MAEIRVKMRLTIEATMYANARPDGRVDETVTGTITVQPDGMAERTISFELRETGEFAVVSGTSELITIPATTDWCDAPKLIEDLSELERWLIRIAIGTHRSQTSILRADCEPKVCAYLDGLLPLERVYAQTAKTVRTTYLVTSTLQSAILAFFHPLRPS